MGNRTCAIDGCTTEAWSRGWCNRHYKRWRRHGDPQAMWTPPPSTLAPVAEKRCSRCGHVLPAGNFWRRSRNQDTLQSACKDCMAASDRERLYGLRDAEYQALLDAQSGKCAICAAPHNERPLVVDHCHGTGRVRGLLCGRCNSAIGLMDDSANVAGAAHAYLSNN